MEQQRVKHQRGSTPRSHVTACDSRYPTAPINDMRLPGFLSLPRKDRRVRNKARSDAGPTQDPSGVDLAAPRPVESDPDLGTRSSTSPTFVPSTSQNRVSSGMGTIVL